ncbi:unnamed protein product [Tilletia laevis]|uniref:Uncharacterized protein n=2 Tax=Tilletia caries TaxID=13290 RepID=A0A177VAI1_9BASI|nr:hypothetical protein A4X03_0g5441 [Tilletia caries]CAD6910770.1 unnamed protein product [Tilletia laevis]CAD6920187.1 unnamed protein product [Tilletia caries]CAD6984615.1 unnamed protein product [Tilletia controversa]
MPVIDTTEVGMTQGSGLTDKYLASRRSKESMTDVERMRLMVELGERAEAMIEAARAFNAAVRPTGLDFSICGVLYNQGGIEIAQPKDIVPFLELDKEDPPVSIKKITREAMCKITRAIPPVVNTAKNFRRTADLLNCDVTIPGTLLTHKVNAYKTWWMSPNSINPFISKRLVTTPERLQRTPSPFEEDVDVQEVDEEDESEGSGGRSDSFDAGVDSDLDVVFTGASNARAPPTGSHASTGGRRRKADTLDDSPSNHVKRARPSRLPRGSASSSKTRL